MSSRKKRSIIYYLILGLLPFVILGAVELGSFFVFKLYYGFERKLERLDIYPWYDEALGLGRFIMYGGYDPFRGYRTTPNGYWDTVSEIPTRLGTDRFGYFHNGDPDRDLTIKPAGTYRIFILGGSTAAGVGAGVNEQTISAYLETILNQRSPVREITKFQVVNAGIGGYTSSLEVIHTILDVVHYEPDLVINFTGWNDSIKVQSPYGMFVPHVKEYHERIAFALHDPPLFTFNPSKLYSTYLVRRLLVKLGAMEIFADTAEQPLDVPKKTEIHTDFVNHEEVFTRNVKSAVGLGMAHGYVPMIVAQPNLLTKQILTDKEKQYLDSRWGTDDRSARIEEWKRMQRAVLEVAGQFKEPAGIFLDLTGLFDDEKNHIYVDHGHYNAEGNGLIAERIADAILARLAASPPPRRP